MRTGTPKPTEVFPVEVEIPPRQPLREQALNAITNLFDNAEKLEHQIGSPVEPASISVHVTYVGEERRVTAKASIRIYLHGDA